MTVPERKDVRATTSPSATPVGSPARHAYCPLCGQARVGIRANTVRDVEAALCPGRCLVAWQALEALREQEATSARVAARSNRFNVDCWLPCGPNGSRDAPSRIVTI